LSHISATPPSSDRPSIPRTSPLSRAAIAVPDGAVSPAPPQRALVRIARALVPRRQELRTPGDYLRGAQLHLALRRGGFTMLSAPCARALYRLTRLADRQRIDGDLVDCGVYNGGSTALLSAGAPDRRVWAFDSFEGLPPPGPLDGPLSEGWEGGCHGTEVKVRHAMSAYGSLERLEVRKGWFEDTFPIAVDEIDQIAVLHCDGDWHDSVLLTLETFYPKVAPGGFVVIDDYGCWEGARRATDAFRSQRSDCSPIVTVDRSGGVYWRKTARASA